MGWQDVTPSDAVEAADWIPGRLNGFAKNVGSIVPKEFEAYARIFHPAWVGAQYPGIEMRWSEVAAANGRIVHPEMQFHAIATLAPGRPGLPISWDYEPRLGLLSARQAQSLIDVLTPRTATPNDCWLCLWEGYGYNSAVWMTFSTSGAAHEDPLPSPPQMGPPHWPELYERAKRVKLPGRDYILFKGSVAQAQGWHDGPNLWWPDDRAWCVASEIDFPYTYVAGSKALIDDILRHHDLEALPARIEDGINANSDKINS
jgi:hypothetical protein